MSADNTDLNDLLKEAIRSHAPVVKLTRWQQFKFNCRLRWHLLKNGVL